MSEGCGTRKLPEVKVVQKLDVSSDLEDASSPTHCCLDFLVLTLAVTSSEVCALQNQDRAGRPYFACGTEHEIACRKVLLNQ
jgi:hypothetical protein